MESCLAGATCAAAAAGASASYVAAAKAVIAALFYSLWAQVRKTIVSPLTISVASPPPLAVVLLPLCMLKKQNPTHISFATRQVKHQLNNDFIGGSLALAVASALVGFLWRLVHYFRTLLHDKLFVTYDIPPGSPQYFAALRWLHHQPAVRRTSRRLVVNPTAPPDAYDNDRGSIPGGGGSMGSLDSAPHDPDDPLELGFHTVGLACTS
jgi:hypothetical protein